MTYINISGYLFRTLSDLDSMQKVLQSNALLWDLKGTILLSEEGINVFVCGLRESIDAFYGILSKLNLKPIPFKESASITVPFDKMLVKIKQSIIVFDTCDISPEKNPAPNVSPMIFKQWLDEDKPMIILDARNTYEVQFGKFKNAIHLNIDHFRDFPKAISNLPEEYKEQTIVTYCTGGIRCEKAAPYLIAQGFKDVYQLEGGIISYLEQFGKAHYEGECFVFDKRISVDANLNETDTSQCIVCQGPIFKSNACFNCPP